jgi:hypothetical protein
VILTKEYGRLPHLTDRTTRNPPRVARPQYLWLEDAQRQSDRSPAESTLAEILLLTSSPESYE